MREVLLRLRFVEDGHRMRGQRHPVLALRLCALRRDRPNGKAPWRRSLARVTLPAGNHAAEGGQTLPVGHYPAMSFGKKKRRKTVKPAPDAMIVEVHVMEEKGSDVNLAAHILNDAWKGLFDAAVVISNHTNLVTPIQMVTVEQEKSVFVVCPGRWQMAPQLRSVASHVRHIHRGMLRDAQFPARIPGTTITRPSQW